MFIDRVRIKLTGGAGGRGCVSFRREKFVPRGGPDGGDGGDGGALYFEAASRISTLLDLKYHTTWKGARGVHGQGSGRHGKNAEDTIIPVPLGTLVVDYETNEVCADLTKEGDRFLAARGGRGGKGNARFATSTNRAPKFSELGEPGEEREYLLELKLIAEVGIVGLPNAGKSTFLARVTAAHPKIGDYPFTTLSPNLGIASLPDYRVLAIADIPGIIEGAAEGKGLGHDFLRHIERTQVLLFLIDLGAGDPREVYQTLNDELDRHSEAFARRRRVVALNKVDVTENRRKAEAAQQQFDHAHVVSAVTGEGIDELLEDLWRNVELAKREDVEESYVAPREYTYQAPYDIKPVHDGYRLTGNAVVRAVNMTDFENEEAVRHLQRKLRQMGVFKALKRMGAQDGQTIHIDSVELVYQAD